MIQGFQKKKTPQKVEDLDCFNLHVSTNGIYIREPLCDLGSNINLMHIETFKKIEGLQL